MGDKWCAGHQAVRVPIAVSPARTNQVQLNPIGGGVRARAKELDAIITELSVEGNDEALATGDSNGKKTGLRMLSIHAKLALLFLRGMSVLNAARMVPQMFAQVPTVPPVATSPKAGTYGRKVSECLVPRQRNRAAWWQRNCSESSVCHTKRLKVRRREAATTGGEQWPLTRERACEWIL